jgi:glycosyltransferase involved in cell wall biosynthesis
MPADSNGMYEHLDLCVLIPCYNDAAGLETALNTIFFPTKGCLVVVVDDGSDIPLRRANRQSAAPVIVLRLERNQGITKALNYGLQWIREHTRARYIARLDCGDACAPDRFLRQVQYLDEHPDVGLLGTWCRFSSPNGKHTYLYQTPLGHKAILKALNFRNVFIHPTIMFRITLLAQAGAYSDNYPHTEDYALVWKMAMQTRVAILPQVLVTCAIDPTGISIRNRKRQLLGRMKVVRDFSPNPLLRILGVLKLKFMMYVPYSLILKIKTIYVRRNTYGHN